MRSSLRGQRVEWLMKSAEREVVDVHCAGTISNFKLALKSIKIVFSKQNQCYA